MSLFDTAGFDAFALSLPGGALVDQWEARVAKVGGKVFALLASGGAGLGAGGPRIVFKCGEDSFEILTAIDGIAQAPYFAKRQWVSVAHSADLPENDLEAYLSRSHDLVARGLTRKARQELGIG